MRSYDSTGGELFAAALQLIDRLNELFAATLQLIDKGGELICGRTETLFNFKLEYEFTLNRAFADDGPRRVKSWRGLKKGKNLPQKRTPAPATRGIGDNGGPDLGIDELFKLIGPRIDVPIEPFQSGAPWTEHASDDELRRLARLQARIERKEAALRDLINERQLIMNRNIRRMRRKDGKN